jgi:carbonic anhydrase/acetyltransferase-like protein (isoleucine patch superfamily)
LAWLVTWGIVSSLDQRIQRDVSLNEHNERTSVMLVSQLFFDVTHEACRDLFPADAPVWAALDGLKEYLASHFEQSWPLAGRQGPVERPLAIHEGRVVEDVTVQPTGPKGRLVAYHQGQELTEAAILLPGAYLFDDRVVLGAKSVVEPGALIKGPTVIGEGTEVRQGAYVRGNCLVGNDCVVGHTTEIKGSILLSGAKAGHFAYIGDSILGRDVNLGAGTKLANLKMIAGNVSVRVDSNRVDTGRRKLGAILGDRTELGCNSVTSPGTLVGPDSIIYPTVAVPPGYYTARTHVRLRRDTLHIRSASA